MGSRSSALVCAVALVCVAVLPPTWRGRAAAPAVSVVLDPLGGVAPDVVEDQPGEVTPAEGRSSDSASQREGAVGRHTAARVLSWSPRVILHPGFLSDYECDYFRARAMQDRAWDNSSAFNSAYLPLSAYDEDRTVRSVEDRIAAVTGVPPHKDQEALCVHRIVPEKGEDEPSDADASTDLGAVPETGIPDKLRVNEIHHDKNNKPWTHVTMVAYLETTKWGGQTIFPCANMDGSESDLAEVCREAFDYGARWFNGKRTVVEGQVTWKHRRRRNEPPPKTPVHEALLKLLHGTSDACKELAQPVIVPPNTDGNSVLETLRKIGPLRGEPRKGDAIFFWHDNVGASGPGPKVGDPMAWHTGCDVVAGEKWTMQKFSEVPIGPVRKKPRKRRR